MKKYLTLTLCLLMGNFFFINTTEAHWWNHITGGGEEIACSATSCGTQKGLTACMKAKGYSDYTQLSGTDPNCANAGDGVCSTNSCNNITEGPLTIDCSTFPSCSSNS